MRAMAAAVASAVMIAATTVAILAHPMTYKGTVISVGASSLVVKATDDMTKKESTKTFKVGEKTKIYRGDTVVTFAAAKVMKDERIAVTINMDEAPDAALEIRLAAASDVMPAQAPMAGKMPMAHDDHAMTVTGCVAASPDAGHYMLTHGMMAGDKGGKSYDLVGGDLKAHVGHKVEVTGTIEVATMKGKTMTRKEMAAMHPTLTVTSLKMISAGCS